MKNSTGIISFLMAGIVLLPACSLSGRFTVVSTDSSGPPEDALLSADGMDPDVGCLPPNQLCGEQCVNTQSDIAHCGTCGTACPIPSGGTAVCEAGACAARCPPFSEYDESNGLPRCRRTVGRQVAPLSGSFIQGDSITFHLTDTPNEMGVESTIDLCSAPDCNGLGLMTSRTLPRDATSFQLDSIAAIGEISTRTRFCTEPNAQNGPIGTIYWRISAGTNHSAVWSVRVLCESALVRALPNVPEVRTRRARGSWGVTTDLDLDGEDEVVIGSPGLAPGGGFRVGGRENGMIRITDAIRSPVQDQAFAKRLVAIGDVNGDGLTDLAVGASSERVYIFYGARTPSRFDLLNITTITSPAAGTGFGSLIVPVGDVDHDGFMDIAITAAEHSAGAVSNVGKVYIYFGKITGLDTRIPAEILPAPLLGGAFNQARFGTAIAGNCDLNGDGFHDFVIGAPGENKAYVYYGARTRAAFNQPHILSPSGETDFGAVIGCIGDVTRDGVSDFAMSTTITAGAMKQIVFYPGVTSPAMNGMLARDRALSLPVPTGGTMAFIRSGLDAYSRMPMTRLGELELLIGLVPSGANSNPIYSYENRATLGMPIYRDPPDQTAFPGTTTSAASGVAHGILINDNGSMLFFVGDPMAAPGGLVNAGVIRVFGINGMGGFMVDMAQEIADPANTAGSLWGATIAN